MQETACVFARDAAEPVRKLERQLQAVQSVRARAGPLQRQLLDSLDDQGTQPGDVGPEDAEHLFVRDALALLDPGVGVGDQRNRGVAERQLAGQDGLGMPGHADERPALRRVPAGLGPGGKPRALDHDQRSRGRGLPAGRAGSPDHRRRPTGQYGSANCTWTAPPSS